MTSGAGKPMALVIKGISGQKPGQPFEFGDLTLYSQTTPFVNPSDQPNIFCF
jgi:hypothetical protein